MQVCKRVVCIVIMLLAPRSFCSESNSNVPRFLPGKQVGTVQTDQIKEASGIAASRKSRGVLWVHNDSGAADIYALNIEGKLLGTYRLKGARCRDWEDIAIGPGPEPKQSYLYIGDIGDNQAKYPFITIYRVPEPAVDPNVALGELVEIGPAATIELTYPDGPKDAETLLVDPLSGDIYVIAKREFFCRVYRVAHPGSTAKRTVMELVTNLPWGFATGGDVSPDGQSVIVRGLFNASLWHRPEGEVLWHAFTTKTARLNLIREPQGEGICFDGEGRGYFTISEQTHPPIYYFARSGSSQQSDAGLTD